MRGGKSDTPGQIEEVLVKGYRRMSPLQKLKRVAELNRSLRTLAIAGIHQRYGSDIPPREVGLRLAALSIDRETMVRAFGWDPEDHGL